MIARSWRWVALTATGLLAGIALGLVLQDPLEALVGMILVTPVVTALVGASLGLAQWIELRRRLAGAAGWLVATTLGLGAGLAAGIVVVEVAGQALLGEPMRLFRLDLLPRTVGLFVVGLLAGGVLGLAQGVVLRRSQPGVRHWALLSALGLGLGFSLGSLLAEALAGGIASPFGGVILVLCAGAFLGGFTRRPAVGAA